MSESKGMRLLIKHPFIRTKLACGILESCDEQKMPAILAVHTLIETCKGVAVLS
jgi:hypothetical protein